MTHEERTRRIVVQASLRAKARHDSDEPVPVPTDPDELWRHRFEDLIYRNLTGLGQEVPGQPGDQFRLRPPALTVLDGGSEGSVVGRRPGPEDAASAVVGRKPPQAPSAEFGGLSPTSTEED